jgi:hypothetical protein
VSGTNGRLVQEWDTKVASLSSFFEQEQERAAAQSFFPTRATISLFSLSLHCSATPTDCAVSVTGSFDEKESNAEVENRDYNNHVVVEWVAYPI